MGRHGKFFRENGSPQELGNNPRQLMRAARWSRRPFLASISQIIEKETTRSDSGWPAYNYSLTSCLRRLHLTGWAVYCV